MKTLISEVTTRVITNVTTAVIATTAPVEMSSSTDDSTPVNVNILVVIHNTAAIMSYKGHWTCACYTSTLHVYICHKCIGFVDTL